MADEVHGNAAIAHSKSNAPQVNGIVEGHGIANATQPGQIVLARIEDSDDCDL